MTGAHQCGLADDTDTLVIGVVQNKPQVTGAAATVAIRGISLVEAGGSVNAGDGVAVDTNGKGVAAGVGDTVVGVAVGGAASGQLVPVLLRLGA